MFSALLQATSRITSALLNTQRRSRPTWSWARIRCTPQSAAEEGSTANRTWSTQTAPSLASRLADTSAARANLSVRATPWTRSSYLTAVRGGRERSRKQAKPPMMRKKWRRWTTEVPDTPATSVGRPMPLHPTWADTSRPTAALTARWHASVPAATRFMCPCRRWPCTSSLTTSSTNVTCAANPSAGPGCFRGTCDHIREKNPSPAPTVGKPSPTGPTYEHTCRRIRPSNTTAASAAIRPSRWSPTWTSTTSPPASEALETRTSLAPRINKREKMKMS